MSAPWGLVGAALVLWGVSIGVTGAGVVAAVAFEASRLAPPGAAAKAPRYFTPVVRVCALLVLAALGYVVATQSLPHSLFSWLRWLPLILLPLAALQVVAGRPPLSSVPDLTHAYAALTLAAAGTGTGAQPWLYPGFALIVGWALLARLPAGRRALAAGMVALAAGVGYGAHVAIAALQGQVEEWGSELLADILAPKPDPFRERTRIGDLGKIKLSDRIVMRVSTERPRPAALLLRESAFDRYRNGEWQSAHRTPRPAMRDRDRWIMSEGAASSRLSVRRTLPGGEGLLPMPLGTRSVENLPAEAVEVFDSRTVRARGTPRFVALGVAYDESAERDAPREATDLEVPELLAGVLARVVSEERLRQPSPAATLEAVRAFFDAKFSYSLNLGNARDGAQGRTLSDFLLRDRKGHCEYFATATVLLLRQAGIPARYVGGYSAQEYSELEKAFVVRARHAHAWVVAYVDGRWVSVDTTPARWAELEGEAARSAFAPLLDRLSWLADRALQAWLAHAPDDLLGAAAATLAVLGLAVILLLLARKLRGRARPRTGAARDAIATAWAGVESRLARTGQGREPGETPRAWATKLYRAKPEEPWRARLVEIARDYYRARFDPAADAGAASDFVRAAREWEAPR